MENVNDVKTFYSFYAHFNDFSHIFELRFRALKKNIHIKFFKNKRGLGLVSISHFLHDF